MALGSLGSSGVRGLTPVGPGSRWVHPWTLGLVGFALGVIGFVKDRGVHSVVHWVSLGSSEAVGFTRVRPGGRSVHPGSWWRPGGRWVHPVLLGSPGFALVVVEFIQSYRVYSGSPWVSLCSSRVVGLTRVRPRVRCVHPESLD